MEARARVSLTISIVWSLALALVSSGLQGAPVRAQAAIVADGEAQAEIVIAEQPPRAVKLAARELQTYIDKITGARLAIVTEPSDDGLVQVFVGESPYAERAGITAEGLEHDAFRMVSGENWLALVGEDADFEPIEPWGRSRSMPWYFNIGRKRGGTEDEEMSIYSPGGDSFHDLMMFGELYVR